MISLYLSFPQTIFSYSRVSHSRSSAFNIRVLVVAPGAFRTEGMYSIPFNVKNLISDYDDIRASTIARFGSVPGTEPGDPVKAMETLVDTVRGEGSAEGKAWPTWLLLGQDAENDLRTKWDKLRTMLEEWGKCCSGCVVLRIEMRQVPL